MKGVAPGNIDAPALIFLNRINVDELATRTGVPPQYLVKLFSDKWFLQLLFERLVDKEGLAENLSLSVSYINKLMRREGLPFFKLGRSVRFRASEVLTWLLERRRP